MLPSFINGDGSSPKLKQHQWKSSFLAALGMTAAAWCANFVIFMLISLCEIFSYAQDTPLDASEISRDLLYLAPSHTEKRADTESREAYVGTRFEYARQGENNWSILPAKGNKPDT